MYLFINNIIGIIRNKKVFCTFCLLSQFVFQVSLSQTLPQWITTFSLDESVCLGVSDPDLKPDVALNQAVLRGASIMGLCSYSHFEKLNKWYVEKESISNEKVSSNQILVSLISRFDTVNIKILNKFYNKFGECFVLLQNKSLNISNVGVFGTKLIYYSSNTNKNIRVIDFIINHNYNQILKYKKRTINSRSEITSYIKDSIQVRSNCAHLYESEKSTKLIDNNYASESLKSFFWDSYITALSKSIYYNYNSTSTFSSLTKQKNTNLRIMYRSIVEEKYTIKISKIQILRNKLYIKTKLIPFK